MADQVTCIGAIFVIHLGAMCAYRVGMRHIVKSVMDLRVVAQSVSVRLHSSWRLGKQQGLRLG